MRPQFRIRATDNTPITAIEGMWPTELQRPLVEDLLEEPCALEGAELLEMLELALQDLEPVDCGMRLLEHLLGSEMTRGMRDDVARDMLEGEPWVHHSHIQWHRAIYEAAWLAHAAHGNAFTRPHGCRVAFAIEPLNEAAVACTKEPLTPALAARLAAPCMEGSILARLFEDELSGTQFRDAPHVVWFARWTGEGSVTGFIVEGSAHWWGAARRTDDIVVEAWQDSTEAEEDDSP
jgi:hypothetical protein